MVHCDRQRSLEVFEIKIERVLHDLAVSKCQILFDLVSNANPTAKKELKALKLSSTALT